LSWQRRTEEAADEAADAYRGTKDAAGRKAQEAKDTVGTAAGQAKEGVTAGGSYVKEKAAVSASPFVFFQTFWGNFLWLVG
jgi:hypothetical protein